MGSNMSYDEYGALDTGARGHDGDAVIMDL